MTTQFFRNIKKMLELYCSVQHFSKLTIKRISKPAKMKIGLQAHTFVKRKAI